MNWELIVYTLEKFRIQSVRRAGFNAASTLLLMEADAADFPGILYIAEAGADVSAFRFALVVSVGGDNAGAANCIVLEMGTVAAVYNALAQVKNYLDTFERLLSRLDNDQEMIDASGMYINCPFFYFDESYRVLAITRDVTFREDDEWRHMLEKGFLSPESALAMKESGDLDRLAAAQKPVVYRSEIFPFTSIVSNIMDEGCFVGRLNMLCIRGDASPVTQCVCEILSDHLKRNLLRGRKTRSGGALRGMLLELLRGTELSETLISDRLKRQSGWEKGVFRVFCLDLDMARDKQVGAYYTRLLQGLGMGGQLMPLVFEEKLVVIVHAVDETVLETLMQKLEAYFEKQHLYGGVSNSFRRLGALAGYYGQALAARELGRAQKLNHYGDYMLLRLLSYIPQERLDCLISPDIARLEEADARNALPLTETLKCYLANGCRLMRTADALFIHKNTLIYRLGRIRTILQNDLDDADTRLLLELSFRLLEARTEKPQTEKTTSEPA